MNPGTELQLVNIEGLQKPIDEIRTMLNKNVGNTGFSEFDLQKVKIMPGGSTAFEVNGLEGPAPVQKLQCIVLFTHDSRSYWKTNPGEEDSISGTPPDCHSNDGVIGIGDPGGACKLCPLAEFGSARNGKGQACKARTQLFILREGGGLLPELLSIPPTGGKAFRQFGLKLFSHGISIDGALLEITLNRQKNDAGQPYAVPDFSVKRRLTSEERGKVTQYASLFMPILAKPVTLEAAAETKTLEGTVETGINARPRGNEEFFQDLPESSEPAPFE